METVTLTCKILMTLVSVFYVVVLVHAGYEESGWWRKVSTIAVAAAIAFVTYFGVWAE
jgi:hypothetical protein